MHFFGQLLQQRAITDTVAAMIKNGRRTEQKLTHYYCKMIATIAGVSWRRVVRVYRLSPRHSTSRVIMEPANHP